MNYDEVRLREQLAEALVRHDVGAEFLDEQTPEWQAHYRSAAEALLRIVRRAQAALLRDLAQKRPWLVDHDQWPEDYLRTRADELDPAVEVFPQLSHGDISARIRDGRR